MAPSPIRTRPCTSLRSPPSDPLRSNPAHIPWRGAVRIGPAHPRMALTRLRPAPPPLACACAVGSLSSPPRLAYSTRSATPTSLGPGPGRPAGPDPLSPGLVAPSITVRTARTPSPLHNHSLGPITHSGTPPLPHSTTRPGTSRPDSGSDAPARTGYGSARSGPP